MIKATATQLKVRLGQYMKAVRAGKTVIVTDRQQPIARLVPIHTDSPAKQAPEVWQARDPAAAPLGALIVAGIRYSGQSTTSLLINDRRRR